MNFLKNLAVVWQKLSLAQRSMFMAMLVVGGIGVVLLTQSADRLEMRPLYTNLSHEDAGRVIEKLAEQNIAYMQRDTGNIYVPKEHVYQLRVDLARAGLPYSSVLNY
jgi:flagellar M-ring protein FliF